MPPYGRPWLRPRSYANARGGVPPEVMVDLANRVGADPWFNMPHNASDDYITQVGAALAPLLGPELRARFEHRHRHSRGTIRVGL